MSTYENGLAIFVPLGFELTICWSNFPFHYVRWTKQLQTYWKYLKKKDTAIKKTSNQLTGYYTCKRVLLERKI